MNPYETLPEEAFWRRAIAEKKPLEIASIWQPRFRIDDHHAIVTAGSCFAQHISNALIRRGYTWVNAEPAPADLSPESRLLSNYGVFSFRTGNIYTAALLKQWIKWALADEQAPEEVWTNGDGRFLDPFRPAIEPDGFSSIEEVKTSRASTLCAIREALTKCDIFVFTLGLTEAWENIREGYVYPMCPGTVAGKFSPEVHKFRNYSYKEILQDMKESFEIIRRKNQKIKFILTVSPVPLTATADNKHVLVATTYSKSTLRAVAGDMASERDDVDYFPSYELITGFPFRGMFFKDNLRSVTAEGVEFVMNSFFSCLESSHARQNGPGEFGVLTKDSLSQMDAENALTGHEDDVVCEEELLAAFGAPGRAGMRLVVIGSSHLAAFKLAWDHRPATFAGTELVFFGAPAAAFAHLSVQNNCLVPTKDTLAEHFRHTSGGFDKIDCSGFDGVLLYGLPHIRILAPLLHTLVPGLSQNEGGSNISSGNITQVVADFMRHNRVLSMIRKITSLPIFVAPAPYPSCDCLNDEMGEWNVLKMNSDNLKIVRDSYVNGIQLICNEIKATLLHQPEETVENFLFTKACFSKGSVRLSKDLSTLHGKNDFTHMNTEFGSAMLASVLPQIASALHKG